MIPRPNFIAHWYYHVPDLILLALICLLVVRLFLLLVRLEESRALPARVLGRVTGPILRVVGAMTPRMMPPAFVIVFAVVWLVALRLALFVAVTARGVRLALG
jgi:uncharacterized protein YggT (Ycf19 family)